MAASRSAVHRSSDVGRGMHWLGLPCQHRRHFCCGARHCILVGSKCLEGLSAFGSALTLIAAFPRMDLVFFRGLEGPAFSLATGVWTVGAAGTPVQLGSYPKGIDVEFGQSDAQVSFSRGQIVSSAASGIVASADYGLCE